MARLMDDQYSRDATATPGDGSMTPPVHEQHSKIALFTLIPVLFVLIIICIVLTVLIYLSIRKREKKQRYQSVSTKDDETVRKVQTLPYPPSVKISSTDYPSLEYSLATQLPQPLEVSSTRYPFIQHQLPGPQASIHEKRPPRLRTKRRGNHKHGRGKHVILGGKQESTAADSDNSPTPPESTDHGIGGGLSGVKIAQIPSRSRDTSPDEPKTLAAAPKPEITLVFKYNESESTLVIIINRVVNLPLRDDGTEVNGYVRIHFTPALPHNTDLRTAKTQTRRKSSSPVFQEELTYTHITMKDLSEMTLHIEVMDYKAYGKHTIIKQTEVEMKKVRFFDGNCKLVLPLDPPKVLGVCNGMVLLSMCFDLSNKKLSVIILRAKDLNSGKADDTDPIAKITITMKDRPVAKLRTKKKSCSSSPIFNEAVSCVADRDSIRNTEINISLINDKKHGKARELGRIVLGCRATGDDELRHWNDTISSPGKHIAEWHNLLCY